MSVILGQKSHFDQTGLLQKSHFLAGGSGTSAEPGRTMVR